MNVVSNECGLKWMWSQMNVVSNDCGLKWMWSQMNVFSNEVVSNDWVSNECGLKCRGLKWAWSQMNGLKWMVSNEWSQMNGLKWIGLNSHGTITRVICHWGALYIYYIRFCRFFCTSVKRDMWWDGIHSDKSHVSISCSAPLSSRFEAWRTTVSNHVLYVIGLTK